MPFHSLALIKTLAGGLAYEASAGEYVPALDVDKAGGPSLGFARDRLSRLRRHRCKRRLRARFSGRRRRHSPVHQINFLLGSNDRGVQRVGFRS